MNKRSARMRLLSVTIWGLGLACLVIAKHRREPPTPTILVLSQVQMRQVPSESNMQGSIAYQIKVFVGCKGPRPSWWGQKTGELLGAAPQAMIGANGPQLLHPSFVDQKGKESPWNPCGMTNSLYDPARQEYYVDCNTEVSNLDVRSNMVDGTIKMGDGTLLPVAVPVRLALAHPPKPSQMSPFL